jgi:hypothetical protein
MLADHPGPAAQQHAVAILRWLFAMTNTKITATLDIADGTVAASVYQQLIGTQAAQYEATYDAGAGLKRFTDGLQDRAAHQLDADKAVA